MSYYERCPHCGAALDPSEHCDCVNARYDRLSPENKGKVNQLVERLLVEQKSRLGATNTETANVETTTK